MTTTENLTATKCHKGQKVIGLGRYGNTWKNQPQGTVTQNRGGWVRVQWDDCCVEDDMRPEWLAVAQMPRPKVDRVIRSVRLRADADAMLVKEAKRRGMSVNETVEALVRESRRPQVTPRFKK